MCQIYFITATSYVLFTNYVMFFIFQTKTMTLPDNNKQYFDFRPQHFKFHCKTFQKKFKTTIQSM